MNRWMRWSRLLALALILLLIGVAISVWSVTRYRQSVRADFRESCHLRAATFEEFAERAIVREQLDSLSGAAMLLLMGNAVYLDVVSLGEILYSNQDEQLDDRLEPIDLDPLSAIREMTMDDLPGEVMEILMPISLAGYEGSSIGTIRIGFSAAYVNALVRNRLLRTAGIVLGIWCLCLIGAALRLGIFSRNQLPCNVVDPVIECGALRIDTSTCEVTSAGHSIDLTPKLYELLLLFAKHPGALLHDADILEEVWSDSPYAASSDVKQGIYMLRRKLGVAHADPKRIIVNVKGFGYRFAPPAIDGDLSNG